VPLNQPTNLHAGRAQGKCMHCTIVLL